MRAGWSSIPFLTGLCLAAVSGAASAQALRIDYSVRLMGLSIGSARLDAELDGERYEITFSGRARGVARLFTDGKITARSDGRAGEMLRPAEYMQRWTEDGDTETIRMRFAGARVGDVSVDPPPRRPERYIPVKAAHKANVLDPASAMIWPAAGRLSPEACNRTLRLFDGRRRFDLELSFRRSVAMPARDGVYSGPAVVCGIRYRPISGHRPDKRGVRALQANRNMEVWMAPAASGVMAPVKIRVGAEFGPVVLEARKVETD
jgi:hypothetical protein